jgi:hypothetical protein
MPSGHWKQRYQRGGNKIKCSCLWNGWTGRWVRSFNCRRRAMLLISRLIISYSARSRSFVSHNWYGYWKLFCIILILILIVQYYLEIISWRCALCTTKTYGTK